MAEILQFPPMRRLYATDGEFQWEVPDSESRDMKELKYLLQLHQDNYPQFMYWIAVVDRER